MVRMGRKRLGIGGKGSNGKSVKWQGMMGGSVEQSARLVKFFRKSATVVKQVVETR